MIWYMKQVHHCVSLKYTYLHTAMQPTLVAEVIEIVSILTTTGMMWTDWAATATLLILCISPPETAPTPPWDDEEQHLPAPL